MMKIRLILFPCMPRMGCWKSSAKIMFSIILFVTLMVLLYLQVDFISSITGLRGYSAAALGHDGASCPSTNNGNSSSSSSSSSLSSSRGGLVYPAIVADSLRNDRLKDIGGTGHWFHLMERVVPSMLSSQTIIANTLENNFYSNETILIVFRERDSAESLNDFGMLILTAALTQSRYPYVVFGYLIQTKNKGGNQGVSYQTQVPMNRFQPTFIADLKSSNSNQKFLKYEHYIKSSSAVNAKQLSFSLSSDACFHNVFPLLWNNKAARKEYTITSSQQFHSLRSAVSSICGEKDDAIEVISSQSPGQSGFSYSQYSKRKYNYNDGCFHSDTCIRTKIEKMEAGVKSELTLLRSDNFVQRQWEIFDQKNKAFSDIVKSCVDGCRKIVIYQRDLYRKIENIDEVSHIIQNKLNVWNSKFKDSASKQNNLMKRSRNTINTSNTIVNGYSCWAPVEVIVHSDTRPVCDLYREISRADVLITPHGFQSTLLLFQPLASTLVEVHPRLAWKPKVYGAMQFGLRDLSHAPRGYVAYESDPPVSNLSSALISLALNVYNLFGGQLDSSKCLRWAICRYATRNQDVSISSKFLVNALDAIEKQFSG